MQGRAALTARRLAACARAQVHKLIAQARPSAASAPAACPIRATASICAAQGGLGRHAAKAGVGAGEGGGHCGRAPLPRRRAVAVARQQRVCGLDRLRYRGREQARAKARRNLTRLGRAVARPRGVRRHSRTVERRQQTLHK